MKIITIKHKGQDIEVRELTVAQLDQILSETGEMSIIDRVFNPDLVNERMLELCTGLGIFELRSCPPSDLRPLVDAVKEVNPDFLAGIRSLAR